MRPLRRPLAGLATAMLLAGCQGEPAAEPTTGPGPDGAEATTRPGPAATATPGQQPDEPGSATPTEEPTPEQVAIQAQVIATGLEAPWDVVFADEQVFLTERDTGSVVELADDGSTEEVARLPVDPAGEGGLLGLVDDPATEDPGFYAYLTTPQDNRVVRFTPGQEPAPVLTGIPSANIHNGGQIAFGPDGMLYVATGDAGQARRAQDPGSLAGKILRITPEGDVPEDNPMPGSPVWTLGHRNVQGLAWTGDGQLYASEFGPDVDDEINRIEPGGNYGWPEVTGAAGVEGYIDPVFVRQPPEASWSGLAALHDSAIPQWDGDLFAAALRGERLWRLSLDEEGAVVDSEELLVGELGRLRRAVQAPDGSLWLLTNNRDGRGNPAPEDDRIVRLGPVG